MKIVVIGDSGFIGAKLVGRLRDGGYDVMAASPSTGVNTVTGEGLAEALAGATVVADVTNSPSLDPDARLAATPFAARLRGESRAGAFRPARTTAGPLHV